MNKVSRTWIDGVCVCVDLFPSTQMGVQIEKGKLIDSPEPFLEFIVYVLESFFLKRFKEI